MSSFKVMSATLLITIACHFQLCASNAMFTVQPQNQTLPLDSPVLFTCDGVGHDVVWVVYFPDLPYSLTSDIRRTQLEDRGVTITDIEGSNLTKLQFTGTIDKNETRVRCRIFNGDTVFSDTATLTLIGPPLAPDPMLTTANTSTLLVTWNEPFTWEGYPVLHYDVKIYETVEPENMFISSSTVETAEGVLEYPVYQSDVQGSECTFYIFSVQAVSDIGSGRTGNVSGGFPIAPGQFLRSDVEIEVTFNQEGVPRIMITIEHPDVCPYQSVDYSVEIIRVGVNSSEMKASRIELEFPNRQLSQGRSFSEEVVDSRLLASHDYRVEVRATTIAGQSTVITSFATYFDPGNTTPSGLDSTTVIAIAAVVAAVIILIAVGIVVCVACCWCTRRKKSGALDSIKNPYGVQPRVIERSQELAYESIDQYQSHPLRRPESPYQSMVPVPDSAHFPALPERKSQLIEPETTTTTYDKNVNQSSNVDTVPVHLETTNRPECYYSMVSEDFYTTMDSAGTLASQSQLSQETSSTYVVNVPDNDNADQYVLTQC